MREKSKKLQWHTLLALWLAPVTGFCAAANDVWTWIDVPTAYCANGTSTGYAVNPHAGATQLLVYLEGGGLCTDQASCWGASPTAANVNGYNSSSFAADGSVYAPFFKRNTGWPFANAIQAYVPYCTGDLHTGTAVANLPTPTYFVGGNNLQQYLEQLHAAYPAVNHIWISGSSAGGAGAMLNQYYVSQTFGGLPVDVIDDSAPPVPNSYLGIPSIWSPRIPPNCPACAQDITGFYDFDRATYPNSRFAVLSYSYDVVLPYFWGESFLDFSANLRKTLIGMRPDTLANTFIVRGAGHVVLGAPYLNVQNDVIEWLSDMVNERADWHGESDIPNPTR